MTPWHVAVIIVGAILEGYAIHRGVASAESVATIIALIIGAAAGNAQPSRGSGRAADRLPHVAPDEPKS